MSRVFSPEEEDFRWNDFEALPELGENLLELSASISNQPASSKLDVTPTRRNSAGIIQVEPAPAGYVVRPLVVLEKLVEIRFYRANRMADSRYNAALVSRLSGAAALELHRPSRHEGLEPEEVRRTYQMIHRKMGDGYMAAVETTGLKRNARSMELYIAAGQLIVGNDALFYGTGDSE